MPWCTYRSDPDCRLAYVTTPFYPIECKQLLLDVSCVSVHSRCISSHMAGAYHSTHFLFSKLGEDRANPSESLWTLQLKCSRLYFPTRYILLYFSSAHWLKIWIKYTTCGHCVCTTKASNMMRTMFPRYFRRILHLRIHNHPVPQPRGHNRTRKRKVHNR